MVKKATVIGICLCFFWVGGTRSFATLLGPMAPTEDIKLEVVPSFSEVIESLPYLVPKFEGFMEYKFSQRSYHPVTSSGNIWNTIQNDPIFAKLPRDVLLGSAKQDISYKMTTEGKVDDTLSLFLDVEQQPDFPTNVDIRVKKDNTEITFGKTVAQLQSPQFVNVNQAIDGFKVTNEDPAWRGIFAQGRERSDPQKYENVGSGGTRVQLGNKSLLEGSVSVYVNNGLQREGFDYTVNYYTGEVTFAFPKTQDQAIKIIYQYTNPIEDFIPLPSRKNFLGAQFQLKSTQNIQTVRQTIPCQETLVVEQNQDRPAMNAVFFLHNTPVVLGDESVTLNGQKLKSDTDYFLDQKGKFILYAQALSVSDNLTISYNAYITKTVKETLYARPETGPYVLAKSNVVSGTLQVSLDGQRVQEIKDYIVDLVKGRLYFNYPLNNFRKIQVTYAYSLTSSVTSNTQINPIQASVTYISESASAEANDLIIPVANEVARVSANAILTAFNPLSTTSRVQVFAGGILVPSSSYGIDGFRGSLTFSGGLPSGNITVGYHYKKSFASLFFLQGKDGYNGSNYVSDSDFDLKNVPPKFQGVQEITLLSNPSGPILLTPGDDYEVTYSDTKPYMQIRFFTSAVNPRSKLTAYPNGTSTLRVRYLYTPDFLVNQGNTNQQIIDITGKIPLSDQWSVSSEVALSQHNLSKPILDNTYSFNGTGADNQSYQLPNKPLVENSESVYVQKNNLMVLQTRDQDYYISYDGGGVKFLNFTPSPTTNIQVSYQYYDTGSTETGVYRSANAYSAGTEYKDGKLTVVGDIKKIDRQFLPIGPISEPRGSFVYGGSAQWAISSFNESVMFDYHRREVFKGTDDSSKEVHLNGDTLQTRLLLNLFQNAIQTDQALLVGTQVQKSFVHASANAYDLDILTTSYEGKATFGPETLRGTLSTKVGQLASDYLDKSNLVTTTIGGAGFSLRVNPKVDWAEKILFVPTFNFSNTRTDMASTYSYTNIRSYGFSSEFSPTEAIAVKLDYGVKQIDTVSTASVGAAVKSVEEVKNIFSDLNFRPVSWFETGLEYRLGQSESPILGQVGPSNDQTSYRITRLALLDAVEFSNQTWMVPFFSPLKGSFLTLNGLGSTRKDNNNRATYHQTIQRIEYRSLEPITGFRIDTMAFEKSLSDSLSLVETSISSQNRSQFQGEKTETQIAVKPPLPILNLFSYNLGYSNRYENTTSFQQGFSTSNTSLRRIPELQVNHKVSFSPGGLFLGTLNLAYEDKILNKSDITQAAASSNLLAQTDFTQNLDVSRVKTQLYSGDYFPLGMILFKGRWELGQEYYNRNLTLANQGSLSLLTNKPGISAMIAPFPMVQITASYNVLGFDQYSSPTIDVSESALKTQFLDSINRTQTSKSLFSTLTPLPGWSGVVGIEQLLANDQQSSQNGSNTTSISQIKTVVGLVFRPIQDMAIQYDYSIKRLDQTSLLQNLSNANGYSGLFKLTYQPLKADNFTVNILYTHEDAWGLGMNDLDQQVSLLATKGFTTITVRERNDTQDYLSGSLDVNIPVPQIPQIDRLTAIGEGQVRKITDRIIPGNTYDVSGVVFRVRALF